MDFKAIERRKLKWFYHVYLQLIKKKKKSHYIHKLIWQAFNGPITEGKIIAHKQDCDTIDEEGYHRNHMSDLYETTINDMIVFNTTTTMTNH